LAKWSTTWLASRCIWMTNYKDKYLRRSLILETKKKGRITQPIPDGNKWLPRRRIKLQFNTHKHMILFILVHIPYSHIFTHYATQTRRGWEIETHPRSRWVWESPPHPRSGYFFLIKIKVSFFPEHNVVMHYPAKRW